MITVVRPRGSSCAASSARTAALDSGEHSGKSSGRKVSVAFCDSLLNCFIFWEPCWQRARDGVRFQFLAVHSVKRLSQAGLLDLHTLARLAFGAVGQLLRSANVSFERL